MLDAIQKREPMKIGRKTVAEILTHKDGYKILQINRTTKDIIRGGKDNKMISHAMESDEAYWPVESLLLSRMKRRDIHLLLIHIKASKSFYISRLASWIDHSQTYSRRKRNGSFQRILPFSHFIHKPGQIKL